MAIFPEIKEEGHHIILDQRSSVGASSSAADLNSLINFPSTIERDRPLNFNLFAVDDPLRPLKPRMN